MPSGSCFEILYGIEYDSGLLYQFRFFFGLYSKKDRKNWHRPIAWILGFQVEKLVEFTSGQNFVLKPRTPTHVENPNTHIKTKAHSILCGPTLVLIPSKYNQLYY